MRKGVIEKGAVTCFIILMVASFSISIVRAENGTLDGDTLTLEGNFLKNNSYNLFFKDISVEFNLTGSDGNLVININDKQYPDSLKNLNSKSNFTVRVTNSSARDNKPIEFTVNNSYSESSLQSSLPSTREKMQTSTPTTPAQEEKSEEAEDEKQDIFDKFPGGIVGMVIGILMLITIILILAFQFGYPNFLFKKDEEPRRLSQVPEQVVQTTYKLKVELNDGTAKIPDRTVKITNKSNYPISETKSDPNGSCIFELPKGTYNIYVKGGENYEDHSEKIRLSEHKSSIITLVKKHILQIEAVDESGKPIRGLFVKVKESGSGIDAPGNSETDVNGIAKFTLSRNKQYTASVSALMMDYVVPGNIAIAPSDTTKRIILKKKEGMLEITVTEQAGKLFEGIPVTVVRKGTNQVMEFISDNNGKINQKVLIGDYIVKINPSASQLYDASEKQVTVLENKRVSVVFALHFNYQPKNETITAVNKHYDKLNNSFIEVSAYDRCIPLFLKSVGETPLKLIERIIKRPVEFLEFKTTPDEIINNILSTEEIISEEISRIMREKSNVDFYFSIKKLPQVEDLVVSDYSQEKFNELIHDTSNYHKNHFREIGNKLHDIDTELTDLSRSLTIQPVADLWRVAQKLQDNCNNEPDVKKKGVMLFINDKLLDHIKEMYTREELRERLKFSLL